MDNKEEIKEDIPIPDEVVEYLTGEPVVKKPEVLGTLTEQDYNYISNISKKQKEISLKIGTYEIEKGFLLKEFQLLFEQQQMFEEQLCDKYNFPRGISFKVDAERNVILINE